MTTFTLDKGASENTPWMTIPGTLNYAITGTWTGTVAMQILDGDNNIQNMDSASYTANTGTVELDRARSMDNGPLTFRFAWTYTSGTPVISVWSNSFPTQIPFNIQMQNLDNLQLENGRFYELESTP